VFCRSRHSACLSWRVSSILDGQASPLPLLMKTLTPASSYRLSVSLLPLIFLYVFYLILKLLFLSYSLNKKIVQTKSFTPYIQGCLRVVSEPTEALVSVFNTECHTSFVNMLASLKAHQDEIKVCFLSYNLFYLFCHFIDLLINKLIN
jgi:hypothetical protein